VRFLSDFCTFRVNDLLFWRIARGILDLDLVSLCARFRRGKVDSRIAYDYQDTLVIVQDSLTAVWNYFCERLPAFCRVVIIDHRTACTFLFLLACSTALGYLFRSTRRVFLCRHRTSGAPAGIVICAARIVICSPTSFVWSFIYKMIAPNPIDPNDDDGIVSVIYYFSDVANLQ